MQISNENHNAVVAELQRAALILMGGHAIPLHEILIVAHAWVMSEMAAQWGPKPAADCARRAVEWLECTPPGPQLATKDGVLVRSIQ